MIATHCDEPGERLAVGEPPLARRRERADRGRDAGRSRRRSNCSVCDATTLPDVGVHLHRDARLAHRLVVDRDHDARPARHVDALQAPGSCCSPDVGAQRHVDARVGRERIVEHEPLRHAADGRSGREVPVGARGRSRTAPGRARSSVSTPGRDHDVGRERLDDDRARRQRLRAPPCEPAAPVDDRRERRAVERPHRVVRTDDRAHDRRRRRCRAARSRPRRRRSNRGSRA